jgi:hypothetical protein
MKASIFLSLSFIALPLANAVCYYQDIGLWEKKWRLSTYRSQECKDKTGDWLKSGFGTWCINIPNDTRSFIFTVGGAYNELNLEDCQIFFKTNNDCTGDQVGRSDGQWYKGKLSKEGERMASAYVQCTRLINKREGAEGEKDRVFIRAQEDNEWYEEVSDGVVIKADVPTEKLEAEAEAI